MIPYRILIIVGYVKEYRINYREIMDDCKAAAGLLYSNEQFDFAEGLSAAAER